MAVEVAHRALHNLLARGERAQSREAARAAQLPFTESSFKQYLSLTSRSAKDEVHAVLREAQRAGAITIEWDTYAGENGQIKKIRLTDTTALATFLGVETHAAVMTRVEVLLAPWNRQPRVREILTVWRELRTVRGRDVHAVADFVDALRVIDFCQAREGEDIAVRAASSALFKSSKRLEELEPMLDALTAEKLHDFKRTSEEMFASLGLVKHPPAVYIAGQAHLTLKDGTQLSVPQSFVAFAPRAIDQVHLPNHVRTVLTVENLTVFHELAMGRAGELKDIAIVFTAGMPAPSFMAFYRMLVTAAARCALLHWGDIDPGGFRIAAVLARAARECSRTLTLWSMRSDAWPKELAYRSLTAADVSEIESICRVHQWVNEGVAIRHTAVGFEQEALPLSIPAP